MIKNAVVVGDNISPARYNVETESRGSKGFTVRSHVLMEILRNPKRWVRGYNSPQTKAKAYGSLFDCLLLTPTQFDSRYCIPPETYTNKDGKKVKWKNDKRVEVVADWLEKNAGKEAITNDFRASVFAAIERLREDALLAQLIDNSQHAVMVVAEWHDPGTGLVIPLKALIDIVPLASDPVFSNSLYDTKSTKNASERNFSKDAQKYGYAIQGGFYLDLYNAATGEQRSEFGHVVQESFPPYEYRTPPPLLTERFLAHGKLLYQRALSIYCRALADGVWPSYDRPSAEWPKTDCDNWYLDAETLYDPIEDEAGELDAFEEPAEVTP